MKLNLVIGGEAGQGLATLNKILSKTFFRMGFNIYSSKDYESRVRGGHNFMSIRFGTEEVSGPEVKEDILLALNQETIEVHQDKVSDDGYILYDGIMEDLDKELISIEAKKVAKEVGNHKAANIVFVGAVLKLLGLDLDLSKEVIKDYFASKGEDVLKTNLEALEKSYEELEVKLKLPEVSPRKDEILIDGNQALGLGAIAGGVQFYSAYPMTPATGVMNYIASKENELGIVVEQAEDEIAAIMMALGGSYSGIRSMTGSSGGGFALMVEALGLAGIAEIPLVIAEVQRPGPATGLPTRTEQGDLLFAINASQGDFPLMVIAPRDNEDAFYQSFRAMNIAENYQMPVVILSDQFLADSKKNIKDFDFEALEIKDGFISDEEAAKIKEYKRYQFTEDGISPLAYPGQIVDDVVLIDSDEHDQKGHIIEDSETRIKMVDKRAKKLEKLIAEDLLEPKYIGPEEIDYLLVGWGSTYGPLVEARELLEDEGSRIGLLSFSDVWPLATSKLIELINNNSAELIVVENNATGQFAKLIRSESGIAANYQILKYDGRPFSGKEIYHRAEEVIR
ncbi:2-oxoacid:acceptor oxidoreductase subunit alpha [Orenia marismortui]|uniref:2-oxoglutarate ferredoxin oxidoreductase subunit alpha n=1 Tax=Orenia marismortui TaxID=46469 RepID=A0A4R8H6H9_9FIRM|nr:2-oxoacid:acceptor oxidoreductase subunit alpha [Orenia marismortui]TDX53186.1 2-oxoglutarate ferredoxin oxidoreductase subunit alpha [Orenia marismortui]